jgi:superfamily II DNA or RNA helicase
MRVLIVVPSAPILQQFAARLASCTPHRIYIEKAHKRAPPAARLVVASQQSLWERLAQYDPATLCLFDECHHANFDAAENLAIAEKFAHVVGLSATPWSRGCEALFADAAHVSLPLAEAQDQGFLAPLQIEDWCDPEGPHAIVFCGTNAEAEAKAAAHPGATWIGVNSGHVEQRIAAWRAGRHPVIYANRMLGEGFDEPRCARIWIDVESESDIRYVQMAGRALRSLPDKLARIHCRTQDIGMRLQRALVRAGWTPEPANLLRSTFSDPSAAPVR